MTSPQSTTSEDAVLETGLTNEAPNADDCSGRKRVDSAGHKRVDSLEVEDPAPHTADQLRPDFRPIIDQADLSAKASQNVAFDPKEHIAFKGPVSTVLMKDLGFLEDAGVSPVAVSQPFKLFSDEAVEHMRAEIFKPEVMEKYGVQSNIAACQIRGWTREYGPFTHAAWNHPETLAILSQIAGVDLVPQFDYEIAHINFSVKSDKQTEEELNTIQERKRFFDDDEGIGGCPWEDDKPVVGWHTDSYPFVCVLMLSDCTNMVGGETALSCPDGRVIKVRGPQKGCGVILQGRYITHQALRALGSKERITAVTSFRPRSPNLKDDSVLTTVRPISDLSDLYYDFADYRLKIMEERIRKARAEMASRRESKERFDTVGHKKFLSECTAFLNHSNNEIVEDDKVVPGYIEETDIPDVVVHAQDPNNDTAPKRVRHA